MSLRFQLDLQSTSLSIVGPGADTDAKGGERFRIIEGDALKHWMDR